MEKNYDEIDLYQLYEVVAKRKWIIVSIVFVSLVFVFTVSYVSPKVYEGVAILHVPLLPDVWEESSTNSSNLLSESISIIGSISRMIKEENKFRDVPSSVLDTVDRISALKMKDSEESIMLRIRIVEDKQNAEVVMHQILNHLKNNKYMIEQLAIEEESLKQKLVEAERSLEIGVDIKNQAIKMLENRNPVGFNPVDLELKMNILQDKIFDFKKQIKSVQRGFEFVQEPHTFGRPVKPRILMNVLLGFIGSLFLGVFVALFLEWKQKRKERAV